jgi:dicarboxylate/amino acid:cation (Na+ or H+) symporter, DAACS family
LGLICNAVGASTGWLSWVLQNLVEPLGKVFLRGLLMVVIPIVFSALVLGVSELELKHLGRLGGRTLACTVVVSSIAVCLGLGLVNLIQPGANASPALRESVRAGITAAPAPASTSAVDLLVAIVPTNPVKAAADGDMLGFVFFSLLFGVALALVRTPATDALKQGLRGLLEVSMTLIGIVLRMAPVGVGALMMVMTARVGLDILGQLAAYVGVALLGLGLHLFGVYSAMLWWLARRSPVQFFKDIRLVLVTAFSTASSNATLPTALRVAEENLKLPNHVSRFVLTAGATMNQNGTALFEGVTVLYLAQVYGVHLGLAQQGIVMAVCVLAGIGTAGVPAGSLPVIAMILGLLGIPPEAVGIVLGVDRFLDMCRTAVNVAGDLVVAAVVARGEPADAT